MRPWLPGSSVVIPGSFRYLKVGAAKLAQATGTSDKKVGPLGQIMSTILDLRLEGFGGVAI